jgi:uncharacterized protein YqgC (DUF456 family)
MSTLAFVISSILMAVGLAGTILPVVPGITLIYCAYVLYGFMTSWRQFGAGTVIVMGIVTAVILALDLSGPALGARRSKGSILGMWGSLIGSVIGLLFFGLPGLVIGTLGGAVVGEIMAGRPPREAMRSGVGALAGLLVGGLVKLVVGLIMVGTFVWQVVLH